MKKVSKLCGILLVLTLLLTIVVAPVSAEQPDDVPVGIKWPEPVTDISQTVPDSCPRANLLNPESPNYKPALHNMGKGTRFDPEFILTKKGGGLRDGPVDQQWKGTRIYGDENLTAVFSDPVDHQWIGTRIYGDENLTAVFARQKSWKSLNVDEDEWLFAPTLLGANYCPLEVVTYYHKESGVMKRLWTIYDHSKTPGWQTAIEIERDDNAAWSRYNLSGYYNTELIWDEKEQKWWACLYNWYTAAWERKYSSSGTHEYNGHNLWEEWGMYDNRRYPDLKIIRAKDLRVYIDDATPDWHKVTPSYGRELKSLRSHFPYDWVWVKEYYYWKVYG